MNLSDVTNPEVGMNVISAIGTPGIIADVKVADENDVRQYSSSDLELGELIIILEWENGRESIFPQKELDKVTMA